MPQRIKGQEVTVYVVRAGQLEDTITAITEFNDEDMVEVKAQGYLGETSDRYDDVYNGTKFDFSLHLQSARWLLLKQAIIDRARRKTSDVVFNVSVTYYFPNGDTPTITFPDVKWGPMTKSIASRGDYVKVKMQGSVSSTDDDVGPLAAVA